MADFQLRLAGGVMGAGLSGVMGGLGGAFLGFTYAKFADLPVDQVVKAWAIWEAAEYALAAFVVNLTENRVGQRLLKASVHIIGTVVGIQELQKRNLMGRTALIVIVGIKALVVLKTLFDSVTPVK